MIDDTKRETIISTAKDMLDKLTDLEKMAQTIYQSARDGSVTGFVYQPIMERQETHVINLTAQINASSMDIRRYIRRIRELVE